TPPPPRHTTGILSLFARVATSAAEGAAMTAPVDARRGGPTHNGEPPRRAEAPSRVAEESVPAQTAVVSQSSHRSVGARGDHARVVIADYDFGDVEVEHRIIEGAGFELVPAQCKSEDEVIVIARDADAIMTQYARVGARAVDSLTRCRVIARYGTGV